ncbi:MAG: TlpA disulfide reductase family protein [Candidatus Neomarinimicrobiota bacterium]
MRRPLILAISVAGLLATQTNQAPSVSVQLMDGRKVALRELHAKGPLVIDFWALWCAPCLKAMRHLDAFQTRYGPQGLTVLAVNLDTERSRSKVRSYVKARGYGFQVALDPSNDVYRRFNGNALPYTLLIDREGRIIYRHTGYLPGDEQALERQIALLLAASSSPTGQDGRQFANQP